MFEYLEDGYALLGRMEGEVPGYLSYGAEEGEVLCVFRGVAEAEEFYGLWRDRIPGEGWGVVSLESGELAKVVENFDLVSVGPRPVPGSTEYLTSADDFIQFLAGSG
ncbi:MAG: hypothetical protein ACR2GU_13805 [Rubrobacteraceae bacterium]